MKRVSILALLCLCMPQLTAINSFAQEQRDPFSNTNAAIPKESVAKKPKVVIHTDTLDQCIEWMQMSYSIAHTQAEIDRLRSELKPDAAPADKVRTNVQVQALLNGITKARRELEKMPIVTTFDLQRWEQFKRELKHFETTHYEQLTTPRLMAAARVRELEQENKQLRDRIRELESNK